MIGEQTVWTLIKRSKRQARELLDTAHHRLWLILALCLWLFTAGAIFLFGTVWVYLADESIFTEQPGLFASVMALVSYGFMLLMAAVLLLPMIGGIVLLALRICRGQTLCAADLFSPFDSPAQYGRCFGLGLYVASYLLSVAAALALGCFVAPSLLYRGMVSAGAINVLCILARIGCVLLGCLLAFALYCFCLPWRITLVLMTRGEPCFQARRHARRLCKACYGALLRERVSLCGHAAVAVVSMGATALLDTLPWLLLHDQMLCDALASRKNET